jgi:hypothetical protein
MVTPFLKHLYGKGFFQAGKTRYCIIPPPEETKTVEY